MGIKNRLIFLLLCMYSLTIHSEIGLREKYSEVLIHYADDSLKYEAALYLIDNMANHLSPFGEAVDNYNYRIRYIKDTGGIHKLQDAWHQSSKIGRIRTIPDSAIISSDYLINNIDQAFAAWQGSPWKDSVSFSLFCRYILPYRLNDEYVGIAWRSEFQLKYGPLLSKVTDIRRAFAILKKRIFNDVVLSSPYCPYTLDPISCLEVGRAECGQRCIVLAAAMRALGIPAAIDAVQFWADYSDKGHAWVSMPMNDGTTYTVNENDTIAKYYNPIDASRFPTKYNIREEDHCPYAVKASKTPIKIYRICYENCNEVAQTSPMTLASPFLLDVSNEYGLASSVSIKTGTNQELYLCAFLSGKDWMPVAKAMPINGLATFSNVGTNSVCTIATYNSGTIQYLTSPFLIGESGIVKYFTPSTSSKQQILIDRKYPLCSYTTDTWGYMRGATFEGADNNDFLHPDTLAIVKTMPHGKTSIEVNNCGRHRYFRYRAPKNNRTSLSELQFYATGSDSTLTLLAGKYFGYGINATQLEMAFDGNSSTICRATDVGYTIGIDLGTDKYAQISRIIFCPSTDLNFVERGHLYELYYFDLGWKIIERRYANTEKLTFNEVPENALLLLRDKTKGKEERIFEYRNGKQIWY